MGQMWDTVPRPSCATWERLATLGWYVTLLVNRSLWIVLGGFALGAAAQSLITAGHQVAAEALIAGIATLGVAIIVIAANRRWTR